MTNLIIKIDEHGNVTQENFEQTAFVPTTDDVNLERDRRIAKGRSFAGIYVTGSATDARNLMSLAIASQMRIAEGDTSSITIFRDGDNVDHQLRPTDIIQIWQWSAGFVENLYKKSWELKSISPIPTDYTDDRFWVWE